MTTPRLDKLALGVKPAVGVSGHGAVARHAELRTVRRRDGGSKYNDDAGAVYRAAQKCRLPGGQGFEAGGSVAVISKVEAF